ncbi:hypothetical protein FHW36_104208 [Chitinophaga polysaccharea]|uniref:Uncharacterized protein n=1 Tax=Chitinophaga polysaccharea TaxID=1293035 RepID=A0A561PQX4_9BACT|nr:hypothetical protein [Chitinophaga polysaccharea]TWF40526.1 hypothetical protein FHW36_104208 [Chitinophaga polysaccharea]
MKQLLLSGAICGVLFSCNQREKVAKTLYSNQNKSLIQELHAGDVSMSTTYLPVQWERALGRNNPDAASEISFRLNIQLPKTADYKQRTGVAIMNVDTLFGLITGSDTLLPLMAQQIANGNPVAPEYLVTFKRALPERGAVMRLVFKDWIYTSHRMEFPFEVTRIENIDSISNRL